MRVADKILAAIDILLVAVVVVMAVFLMGSLSGAGDSGSQQPEQAEYVFADESETSEETETETETETEDERTEEIRELIGNMTTEEKAAQLFVVTPEALTEYPEVTIAGDITHEAYNERPVGGLVLSESNLTTAQALYDMTENLHQYSTDRIGVPVLVCVDEEGGIVARLANHDGFEIEDVGDMADVGATNDAKEAYEVGTTIGTYLGEFSIDVDFAPVADVWWNSDNTVVADRSFGSDPDLVSDMVAQEIKGLQEQGILTTLKHFPGHGGTTEDSHEGTAVLSETMEEMEALDLLPFEAGIQAGADLVMMGHICTPEITDEDTPASLSSYWITDVLRGRMGFDGVVITDALNMSAITEKYSSGEACVKALQAGADMLLMPADFTEAYQSVLQAIYDGEITEERLEESLVRILELKVK